MRTRVLRYALATLAVSGVMFAQAKGGGGTPTTPTPTKPSTTGPFPANNQSTGIPQVNRPIFVSGRVMMEDGTAPPESVVIRRVCSGVAHAESYTDSKGNFSFELGRRSAAMMDASAGDDSGFGDSPRIVRNTNANGSDAASAQQDRTTTERNLLNCELDAYLPGFRSDTVNLNTRKTLDNPEVGTLILHRLGNVEGLTISATSSMAPKEAKKAFEKAQAAFKKQKWEDAQKELEKAVEEYPKYAVAWYQLGVIRERQGKLDLAKGSFREALKADGKYVSPYGNLANIALHEKNWQEAQDTSGRGLRLNPVNFPQLWLFNAYANLQLHHLDVAETSAREGIKIDPNHNLVKLEQLLGLILASQGKYAEAADHVREYIARSPDATDLSLAQKQLREMEQRAAPASAANPTQ